MPRSDPPPVIDKDIRSLLWFGKLQRAVNHGDSEFAFLAQAELKALGWRIEPTKPGRRPRDERGGR